MAYSTTTYKTAKESLLTVLANNGVSTTGNLLSNLTDAILDKDFAPIVGGGTILAASLKVAFNTNPVNTSVNLTRTVTEYNSGTSAPDVLNYTFSGIGTSNYLNQVAQIVIKQVKYSKLSNSTTGEAVVYTGDIVITDPLNISITIPNNLRLPILETDTNNYNYVMYQLVNDTLLPQSGQRAFTLVDDRVVIPTDPVPPTGTGTTTPVPPTGTGTTTPVPPTGTA